MKLAVLIRYDPSNLHGLKTIEKFLQSKGLSIYSVVGGRFIKRKRNFVISITEKECVFLKMVFADDTIEILPGKYGFNID